MKIRNRILVMVLLSCIPQPDAVESEGLANDTLELPAKTAKLGCDSFCMEFRKYWVKVEEREGFDKYRSQIQINDIDKTWVPHFYLFDSNVVVFPEWFVIRNKNWW